MPDKELLRRSPTDPAVPHSQPVVRAAGSRDEPGDKADDVSSPDAAGSGSPRHEPPSTADRPPPALERRFRQLARKWIKETEYLSSAARMAEHPAYQDIIELGAPAVPLLLAELRRRPEFWFAALRAITGENTVPPQSAGKLKDMATAWLAWGQAKGLIP